MALTEFGALVRKARIDGRIRSLGQMAEELGVSAALLSGMETGRRRIGPEWVKRIESYFAAKGVAVLGLGEAADVANQTVSLEGLNPEHQMLLAAFARAQYMDQSAVARFKELLTQVQQQGERSDVRKRSS